MNTKGKNTYHLFYALLVQMTPSKIYVNSEWILFYYSEQQAESIKIRIPILTTTYCQKAMTIIQ